MAQTKRYLRFLPAYISGSFIVESNLGFKIQNLNPETRILT